MVSVCQSGLEAWATRSPYATSPIEEQKASLSANKQWIELRQLLVRALRPFPDAWKAVLEAITTVEGEPANCA